MGEAMALRVARSLMMLLAVAGAFMAISVVRADAAQACGTQVRSLGSQNIDRGTTCNVSSSSYRYSRLTGGIQRWLNQLGMGCGTADGNYGPATTSCVQTFQFAGMNRPVPARTGVTDSETWRAMEAHRSLQSCVPGVCSYSTWGGTTVLARRYDELDGVRGRWTIANRNGTWLYWNTSSQW
jgi:hypothetical protein